MGRKAGVAAEETRATLLGAAARVFARRGYDGASISEITSEAGLTSGAIYAHYGSKAELFVATLRTFMERDLDKLLGRGTSELVDGIASVGSSFDHHEPTEESLVISAIIAARNDPEVAALLAEMVADRERLLSGMMRDGQETGVLRKDVAAAAMSRLSLMVAMGSLVVGALGLEPLDHGEWARLVGELVEAFRA